jgi:hypothetical protein
MNKCKRAFLAGGLLMTCWLPVFAQDQPGVPPATPADSLIQAPEVRTQVQTGLDTLLIPSRPKHSPRKALLLSLALPGMGQIYNRSYWKLPLIYGGFGALGYFLVYNNNRYQEFAEAYLKKLSSPNEVVPVKGYPNGLLQASNYKLGRDTFRRNFELTIILTAALWALNMIDANVDAHMKGFDLSDDISMHIRPSSPGITPYPTAGLSLVFTWK